MAGSDIGTMLPSGRMQLLGAIERRAGPQRLIGYARVSTDDQKCAAQVYELGRAGCTEIVQEYASGADRRRPALARIVATILPGEALVVVRLDRLARSVPHLLHVLEQLQDRGAGLRSLSDPIDTSSPSGRFVLTILGAVAELERSLIIERTRAGVAAARRDGRIPGHPGLLARDPAAIAALARHRSARSLDRAALALAPFFVAIAADRPDGWETIARRTAAAGGPNWSGERLRRTWQRLEAAGRIGTP